MNYPYIKPNMGIGLVCISDGQNPKEKVFVEGVKKALTNFGCRVKVSPFIYTEGLFPGTVKERAGALMDFYKDPEIDLIMDVSGGDIANMVLPYLDFEVIKKSKKVFWGYSDLSTIHNAIYTMTGNEGMLYQIKSMMWDISGGARNRIKDMIENPDSDGDPFVASDFQMLKGTSMEGVLVGGNFRCTLKLSGTKYFPDLKDKVLLLEGLGGGVAQFATAIAQLEQIGAFDQVAGILLGTFTKMEKEGLKPSVEEMLLEALVEHEKLTGRDIPVAKCSEIGHAATARGIVIGKYIKVSE